MAHGNHSNRVPLDTQLALALGLAMAFFNITLLGPQEPFKVAVRKPAAEDKLTTESPTAASLSGPSQVSPGPSQTPPAQGPSLTPPGSSKTSPRQARWSREPIPSPLSSRSSPRPGQTSPQLSHTLPGPIQALPRPSTTIPGLLSYVGGQASPTGGQASPTGAAQGMLSPTGAAQGMLSPTGAVYPEGTHLVTVSKEKEGQQPQSPAKPHERVMEPSSTATAKEDELPPLHPSLIATAPFAERKLLKFQLLT